jgi:hypothetical protein
VHSGLGAAGNELWWNRDRPPRWPSGEGTDLLDSGILRVARVAGHRCTECGLVFFEYEAVADG